jgi:dTDP-4-amino-4,6-dideoxygalactose transaminase
MDIPFVDLVRQYNSIKPEMDAVIQSVLEKGDFVLGENVRKFEKEFAQHCNVKHGIGVNSATDALTIALKAVGITDGDEVLVPVNSFIASANIVIFCGGKPVFVDVESDTLNIDPEEIEKAITPRTKAVISVHLHGHPANMDPILEIAQDHGLVVIEDVAQAVDALYKGKKVGSLGDIGCFSFYPTKNLGAYGDGGMAITDNDQFAEKIHLLRNYGRIESEYKQNYVHRLVGYNSRLDEIQAAILGLKLKYIDQWNRKKGEISKIYSKSFADEDFEIPVEKEYAHRQFWDYCIQVNQRDTVQEKLAQDGIKTAILYRIPIHLQEAYGFMGLGEGSFPVAEQCSHKILSLPLFPELKEDEIEYIIETVKKDVE